MEMYATWLNIVNDNVIIPNPLNKNSTLPISIGTASSGAIKVDIYLSLDIILYGYTTEKPIMPTYTPVFLSKDDTTEKPIIPTYTPVFLRKEESPKPDTYELNWYTYGEEEHPTPDTYKLNWYTYEE